MIKKNIHLLQQKLITKNIFTSNLATDCQFKNHIHLQLNCLVFLNTRSITFQDRDVAYILSHQSRKNARVNIHTLLCL